MKSFLEEKLDAIATTPTLTRKIVPILPGEPQVQHYLISGCPIPEGMREESDDEFRVRVKQAMK